MNSKLLSNIFALRFLNKIFVCYNIPSFLIVHTVLLIVMTVLCSMFTLSLSTIIENNNEP
jgi:hypothetical protein